LRKGVDILVATPGRLLDLINQKHINLSRIKIFVLDEADRMLDMGFVADVKKILTRIPKHRQTLFFSATMIPSIMDLAHTILKDPVQVKVTPVSSTVDTVTQSLYTVSKEDKKNLLLHILQNPAVKSAVVFTKTKHGANKVEKILSQAKIPSAALHGNKSQNARQQALAKLKDGSIRVLVATDIAARGIDIDQLSHVIIHDVPLEPEVYVHRIGRTGRAGMRGDALMFCEPSEVKYLKQIVKVIGKDIPHVKDHPYHSPHSTTVVTEQPKPQRNLPPRNQRGAPLPGQSRQGAR
jgi:ATP-dependent RNA helicase RhlE